MSAGEWRTDPVSGAAINAAVEALSRPQPNDTRTPEQRRVDALEELAQRALASGELPDVAAAPPRVLLLVDEATLAEQEGAHPALLDGYGAVSNATARMLLCGGEVTPLLIRFDGKGVARRLPPPGRAGRLQATGNASGGCAVATRRAPHGR